MKEYLNRKRKGFTLVELLIVIVVIGILSAMMMLSSSEAVSSAKATAIVSDLRNIKTAVLAYLADNADTKMYETPADKATIPNTDWLPYLNGKGDDLPAKDSYWVVAQGGLWYVECNIGDQKNSLTALLKGKELASVKKKLAGRAKSVGLLTTHATNSAPYTNGNYVYVRIQ